MDPSYLVRCECAKLLKKANLSRIRFRDLRHSAATILCAQRISPKVVSETLGLADIAITPSRYGRVTPPMQT